MLLRHLSSCRFRVPSLNIPGKATSCTEFNSGCPLFKSSSRALYRPERGFSEKVRDPKDFTWQSGRPDDPKRPKQKWTKRPEEGCEVRNVNNKNKSQAKKASDVQNPQMWTGRPKETCVQLKGNDPKEKSNESTLAKLKKRLEQSSGENNGFGNKVSFVGTSTSMPNIRTPVSKTIVNIETTETGLAPPNTLTEHHYISPNTTTEKNMPQKQIPSYLTIENSKIDTRPSEKVIAVPEVVSPQFGGILGQSIVMGIELDTRSPANVSTVGPSLVAPSPIEPTKEAQKFDGPSVGVDVPMPDVITQRSSLRPARASQEKRPTTVPAEAVQAKPLPDPNESYRQKSPVNLPVRGSLAGLKSQKMPKLKVVRETFNEKRRHRVYSFGLSETGALGLYKPNKGRRWRKFISRPLRHEFAEETRVISAESGYGFTLFYVKSENNVKLYGCGLNTDFQLGPTVADLVTYPSPVDIHINSPSTKIVSFSAGRAHSAVATDNEGVFLFGSNSYGQCGRAVDENDKTAPACTITQIKSFGGEKVVGVNCGQDHTCFVTESGKVYTCGWGTEGQTGLGHTSHSCEPSLVRGEIEGETIVKVTGKCDTVLALNERGELFGWGSNEFRQLLDDRDTPQVDSPLRMAHVNLICGKIVDIAAGSSFCMVLNQDGDVYVWGYGILGGGPELDRTTVPTLLPRTLFGTNEYQPKAIPLRLYCGLDHMAVMNSLNHVYSWGKNKHGCLGIGNARDQYFPYKLSISANAVHVSCAVDHTVIVTDHN